MFHNRPFWALSTETTRRAQYAGSWYEGNAAKLKAQLDEYLLNAEPMPDATSFARLNQKNTELKGSVLAIVSPHAGYIYSGQTAAFGFKAAQRKNPARIFVLGPSHHFGIHGVALPPKSIESFATPLGDLELDRETLEELKTYPLFTENAEVHKVEHSLELQLPFIKHCFPSAKIVPVVIGQLEDEAEARLIGEILKGFLRKNDLIVVSSDFTHYGPRYDYEPFGEFKAEKVAGLDGEAFQHLRELDLEGFISFQKRTRDTICGMYPCQVLLSMLPVETNVTAVKYATSSDVSSDEKENSVSYLSIIFSGEEWPEDPGKVRPVSEIVKLNKEERKSLLLLARQTIDVFVKENRRVSPKELGMTITPAMKACFGVFVTLMKKEKGFGGTEEEDLRGCIGSIYPVKPLWQAVQDNAIASSTRDHRFTPVQENELNDLIIDINILTPPRRVASYNDIVIGRDGVILSKDRHQAVFLPQVAVEWNWTLPEMLAQLAQKAGLHKDDWRDGCKFDVFQSEEIR